MGYYKTSLKNEIWFVGWAWRYMLGIPTIRKQEDSGKQVQNLPKQLSYDKKDTQRVVSLMSFI